MLYLDSALRLTHGSPFTLAGMLTRLRPSNEFFTAVAPAADGAGPLIGQVSYRGGEKCARLTYLLPLNEISSPALSALLEALAWQAGEWGAFHLLADNAGKLPADDEKRVRDALEELRKAKDNSSLESIRKAIDDLNGATHKMAEKMYSQAQAQQGGGPGSQGPEPPVGGGPGAHGSKPGDVIDADFEDVK